MASHAPGPARSLVLLTWTSFVLIGWTGVLVPALVPEIQARFAVDDAAVGIYYFVYSAAYAGASFLGGFLTERLGRRAILPGAMSLLGAGLVLHGIAPTSIVFLVAAVGMGAGAGAIDGGINGVALAIHEESRGRALNFLHLFFAACALSSPIVVGRLVGLGVPWQPFFVGLVGAALLSFVCAGVILAAARSRTRRALDPSPSPT